MAVGDVRALRLCLCDAWRLLAHTVHGGDLGECIATDETDLDRPLTGQPLGQRGHFGIVDLPLGNFPRPRELGLLL